MKVTELDNDLRKGVFGCLVDVEIVITDYRVHNVVCELQGLKKLLAGQIILSSRKSVVRYIMSIVVNTIQNRYFPIIAFDAHILAINQQYTLKLLTVPSGDIDAGW